MIGDLAEAAVRLPATPVFVTLTCIHVLIPRQKCAGVVGLVVVGGCDPCVGGLTVGWVVLCLGRHHLAFVRRFAGCRFSLLV